MQLSPLVSAAYILFDADGYERSSISSQLSASTEYTHCLIQQACFAKWKYKRNRERDINGYKRLSRVVVLFFIRVTDDLPYFFPESLPLKAAPSFRSSRNRELGSRPSCPRSSPARLPRSSIWRSFLSNPMKIDVHVRF